MNTIRFILVATLASFFSLSSAAQDKPKDFATFFADASVELLAKQLGPGQSLGHAGRDSTNWQSHYDWASNQNIETIRADLAEKFSIMVDVKAETGRTALGEWYGFVCSTWSQYRVDFGSSAANSTNATGHGRWASSRWVTLDSIKKQLTDRINKIAASYTNLTTYNEEEQPHIVKPPDDIVNLPVEDKSTTYGLDSLTATYRQEFEAKAKTVDNSLVSAQQHVLKVEANSLRQKFEFRKTEYQVLPKFEKVRIDWLYPTPYQGGSTITCGNPVVVQGIGFGNKWGVASLHLDVPINGRKIFNFEPAEGKKRDECWRDDMIHLTVPVISGFREPVTAVIRVNRSEGNYLPDDYKVTVLPKMVISQISGLNFFYPDFQDDMSTYSVIGSGKFLFVSHHPDCGIQGDSGVDVFFAALPEYFKVKKVVFTQIDPARTEESFRAAIRAVEAVINAIKSGVIKALLWEAGKEIVDFIGGLFGAGNYGCKIIKYPDEISPLMFVKWNNTCWPNEYRNKPVMYLVTFFVLGPEGIQVQ